MRLDLEGVDSPKDLTLPIVVPAWSGSNYLSFFCQRGV